MARRRVSSCTRRGQQQPSQQPPAPFQSPRPSSKLGSPGCWGRASLGEHPRMLGTASPGPAGSSAQHCLDLLGWHQHRFVPQQGGGAGAAQPRGYRTG